MIMQAKQIEKALKEGGFTAKQVKSLTALLPALAPANENHESGAQNATKNDVKIVELTLRADIEKTKSELEAQLQQVKSELEAKIDKDIADLKSELSEKIHRSTITTIITIVAIMSVQLAIFKFM